MTLPGVPTSYCYRYVITSELLETQNAPMMVHATGWRVTGVVPYLTYWTMVQLS